jgi:hypothetical protein
LSPLLGLETSGELRQRSLGKSLGESLGGLQKKRLFLEKGFFSPEFGPQNAGSWAVGKAVLLCWPQQAAG